MLADILNMINDPMATIPVVLLSITGLYFTIEMFRLLTDGCPTTPSARQGWIRSMMHRPAPR